ncbi:MAG: outer membrane beta-barrel protein [Gemmatimonadales bacterium]
MPRALVAFALLALTASAVTSLAAQDRRGGRDRGLVELPAEGVRSGFFISGTVGAGAEQNKYSVETEYTQSLTKPTLGLRLGGTPNSSVRVGGEFFGWFNSVDGGTETFGAALVMAQVYPVKTAGLYLKAGGGIAQAGTPPADFIGPNITETGFGWSVGAGFDIALSPQVSVGPTVDFYKGTFTKRNEPTLSDRVLNIGVQLSFQTGGRRR